MSKIENHPRFELACDQHEQECSMRGGDYITPTAPIDYVVDDKTDDLSF